MFAIVGIVVVIAAIIGGYLMEDGPLHVLWQPAELVIILGAATGTMLVSNPVSVLKMIAVALSQAFKGGLSVSVYKDALGVLYELFMVAKKNGLLALEGDVSEPDKSAIFRRHPLFLAQKEAVHFACDALRMLVDGSCRPDELEAAMDTEIETHGESAHRPITALSQVADAMPGMGIVAAVMGVVIAVQGIDGPPAEIGHKIGAALVGTFLGILMSYGFMGPLASMMTHRAKDEERLLQVMKTAIAAFSRGTAPATAVDLARRLIFPEARPSGGDMNAVIAAAKKEAA